MDSNNLHRADKITGLIYNHKNMICIKGVVSKLKKRFTRAISISCSEWKVNVMVGPNLNRLIFFVSSPLCLFLSLFLSFSCNILQKKGS